MWSDTVTIYRKIAGEVERTIVHDCCFEVKMEEGADILGARHSSGGFLAVPAEVSVQVGDRVIRGEGEDAAWEQLDPVRTPGLMEVRTVQPCYLHGALHHIEARGK